MKPDYRRIHKLEYELGYRDDPPPLPPPSDAPGSIMYYRPEPGRNGNPCRPTYTPRPQTLAEATAVLKRLRSATTTDADRAKAQAYLAAFTSAERPR